ncbi:L,D-transpeptidase [Fictibacillus phosphorivorans]|uniref:L,D-transpeptidase n=1 Tax=Fictibacillus phosphorivorans TaxID=1221500 RepID=A0A163R880_9BACL|nr:L,D-transpeptidase [Fictibacillus phosphorivorans]KZE66348.1 L,D-transpeptidase [Fictibacillus phosphorivorans]
MVKLSIAFILLFSPLWPIGNAEKLGDPYVIVNKTSNRLALIEEGKIKEVYKVATGKSKELTPEGEFTVTVKAIDPYYRKKDIPGGDKTNPLGSRWIGFDAQNTDGRTFGVHGNNNPAAIGRFVTAGCIRMYEKDVQELYRLLKIGTKIKVIQSHKSFEDLIN